jgi:hypothetical protein
MGADTYRECRPWFVVQLPKKLSALKLPTEVLRSAGYKPQAAKRQSLSLLVA